MFWWDAALLGICIMGATLYNRSSTRTLVPTWRKALFYAGLSGFAILCTGPLARAALNDFELHMVQHVGLMMLVAPALVLGAPVRVWAERQPDRVTGLLSNPALKLLLNPRTGFMLFVSTLFATHFSSLASWANSNVHVHQGVLLLFVFSGFIYYYAVLDGNPLPAPTPHAIRIISLLAMMVPETMTGFFLYASSHTFHAETGMDALTQQRAGGALMWAAAMAIDTIWIAVAVRDWLADEEVKSRAL